MERFRLRALEQPRKGLIWELKLFPDHPGHTFREKDGRIMGSSSVPATILWLRQVSAPYLKKALSPGPMEAEQFGPQSESCWLAWEDGLRLSLAFSNARYLRSATQKRKFKEGLYALPSEVVLYWFTLCFYGYRQAAGKAAFRTLLTYQQKEDEPAKPQKKVKGRQKKKDRPSPTPLIPLKDMATPGDAQDPAVYSQAGSPAQDTQFFSARA
jgi:hypothetical protein